MCRKLIRAGIENATDERIQLSELRPLRNMPALDVMLDSLQARGKK